MPATLPSILLSLFLVCTSLLTAQVDEFVFENAAVGLSPEEIKHLKEGRARFVQEQYAEAAGHLEKITHKEQPFVNYLLGICYTHDVDNREKGLQLIRSAGVRANEINGYNYHLAYALMKNDSIQAALTHFNNSLEIQDKKSNRNAVFVNEIKLSIEHCKNILEFRAKRNQVRISNLGPPVNTTAHEYCPLIPSNEEVMIYTYRGPKAKGGRQKIKGSKLRNIDDVELFFEDIFISHKINDTLWEEPVGIGNLNTGSHDAAVSLNADGSELIIYKNRGKGKGDLYFSKLVGDNWSKPVLPKKLNSTEWDGSACFMPGQDKIIFSSERKGGQGGKDLYMAERVAENTWGNITNMGPGINTKYDEDAPFVTSDGEILFFSSNNRLSLGGYDIFRSDFVNGEWLSPYNLGPPINSINDDNYFIVRGDGRVGYYSSYKKGGDGGQDIYKVEPGIPGKPVTILQVDGLVTVDGKPTAASVDIKPLTKTSSMSYRVSSNKLTGKFLCNLPAGDEYELQVYVERFPKQVILLNTSEIDSFVVVNVFADFTSPSYETAMNKSLSNEAQLLKQDSVFDKGGFTLMYGEATADSLYFTIQLAAFKFRDKYNYNSLVGLPKVTKHTGKDKVNRYTMGRFATYNEAQKFLKQVQPLVKDAFITAFYNGERKLVYQLVEQGILKR
jgi:hypothetical protein